MSISIVWNLGAFPLETILQIINDVKNNKQICYRQLIGHKIIIALRLKAGLFEYY